MAETFNPISSSFIDQLDYDDTTDTLTITFSDGNAFDYMNVSPSTYRNFCIAPSAGQFFHRYIKGKYPFEPN
jgi:lysyl-tRNA synthetase class 2